MRKFMINYFLREKKCHSKLMWIIQCFFLTFYKFSENFFVNCRPPVQFLAWNKITWNNWITFYRFKFLSQSISVWLTHELIKCESWKRKNNDLSLMICKFGLHCSMALISTQSKEFCSINPNFYTPFWTSMIFFLQFVQVAISMHIFFSL